MRLGILGCGAIGAELAAFAAQEAQIESVLLFDALPDRSRALVRRSGKLRVAADPDELVAGSDFLVEAASPDAARGFLPRAVDAGKAVLAMSMGVLADDAWRQKLFERARKTGAKIYLPSGAVCGIDGLKAGALAHVKSVTLVTTKPPAALGLTVDKWTVVYDGPARDAVKKFPQNVNVAATLSLAGIGFDDTRVQVVADPLATRNQHKVIIEGDFGRIRIEVENLPSPQNPKTSWLASLSAIATIKRVLDPVQIGA